MSGEIPPEASLPTQAANLQGLARLLELDGFQCSPLAKTNGQTVPVLVEKEGAQAALGVQSALLSANWEGHSLQRLLARGRIEGKVFNAIFCDGTFPTNINLFGRSSPSL
jgi:hypothetical protein